MFPNTYYYFFFTLKWCITKVFFLPHRLSYLPRKQTSSTETVNLTTVSCTSSQLLPKHWLPLFNSPSVINHFCNAEHRLWLPDLVSMVTGESVCKTERASNGNLT
ncbi:hypothetical protein FQA47_018198 [Oryzias melastigma]|uniref:Uncharacterized protein n=1 Tax=Oryzias melastigma TaxID=30732 RepID=A0A834BZC6_ORYME|nr:hypothetical protein FQA47_018198 [Oryzias melastigma]